ncbi:MAG: hypothetical protein U1E76_25390 [Planctomycetota bacterium]
MVKELEVLAFVTPTGQTQKFANVPVDHFIRIEEGASTFQLETRKAIHF